MPSRTLKFETCIDEVNFKGKNVMSLCSSIKDVKKLVIH